MKGIDLDFVQKNKYINLDWFNNDRYIGMYCIFSQFGNSKLIKRKESKYYNYGYSHAREYRNKFFL